MTARPSDDGATSLAATARTIKAELSPTQTAGPLHAARGPARGDQHRGSGLADGQRSAWLPTGLQRAGRSQRAADRDPHRRRHPGADPHRVSCGTTPRPAGAAGSMTSCAAFWRPNTARRSTGNGHTSSSPCSVHQTQSRHHPLSPPRPSRPMAPLHGHAQPAQASQPPPRQPRAPIAATIHRVSTDLRDSPPRRGLWSFPCACRPTLLSGTHSEWSSGIAELLRTARPSWLNLKGNGPRWNLVRAVCHRTSPIVVGSVKNGGTVGRSEIQSAWRQVGRLLYVPRPLHVGYRSVPGHRQHIGELLGRVPGTHVTSRLDYCKGRHEQDPDRRDRARQNQR